MDANQKPQAAFEMTPVDLESDSSALPATPPQWKKTTTTLPTCDDELQFDVHTIADEQWAGFVERLTGAAAVESVSADPNLP